MTVLAGFWSFDPARDPRGSCERMLTAQQVYAPEAARCGVEGEVALGRRLFKLLPEEAFDRGPVVGADGTLLVADVRIDNRDEMCAALGIDGPEARRCADVALLSRALEVWGPGACDRLVGDFAFAWWNPTSRSLTLARDFLGQRPLHYHVGDGFVACASMPKGLHALPDVPRAPDAGAAAAFLAHVPEVGDRSYFEGIKKVPPGHVVVITRDGVSSRRYWRPERIGPLRLRTADDYAQALRAQLDAAVASRLRGAGDGAAAHLSGGLDSSAVAATAARLLGPMGGRVIAYTSVPRADFVARRGGLVDEGPLAAAVADLHDNVEHVLIRSGARSPLDSVDRNAFLYERPYLNLCNGVWIDAINDDARRRGLRVLLTGTMGNASFSFDGMQRLPALLASGRLLRLAGEAVGLLGGGMRAGTLAAATIGPFLPKPWWRAIDGMRGRTAGITAYSAIKRAPTDDPRLPLEGTAHGIDRDGRPRRNAREVQLGLLERVDFGNYNKGTLGGWGIDVRDPSADRRLVEFCLSVPVEQYLAGGRSRALARRAFTDRLPASVAGETRKGYQGADWYEGLTDAREQVSAEIEAIARNPAAASLIDLARLRRLEALWPDGSWEEDEVVASYRYALLRGLSLGHFVRKVAGTN